ncbi:transaldolase [Cellulosimicrobium sp. CUA-896]|uniref:transaldolase n=1 Tax=Cellulosimicrobium sp. CUA-896 TaxID=1517881 RepID=UPI0009665D4B|nr:transaldolase [Cellulosimicrobium sp. CUA-896]OLT53535.1 transaldolase [Cellulosimicrobium sp. CUA-896]
MTQTTVPGPIDQLRQAGVSIWLDDLSRERLRTGNLADLVAERGVVGVTTNPTIFASALAKGDAYDAQLAELARDGADVEAAVERITTDDVRAAADLLRPVHDATDGVDGRVSIEVDPRLADEDASATVEVAERLWRTIDRPNVYIKIPATLTGLDAITQTLAKGISVNVTLIFSLERYRAVMDAFATGLEQARAAGIDLAPIGSVASFFVSRVDSAVDAALEKVGTPEALDLRGRAAIANARLAFEAYQEFVGTDRWRSLAAAGARPQRPLWASTGVKNPEYPDTMYVSELVTDGVVNTMPEATLQAFADHGAVTGDTVVGGADAARRTIEAVESEGISMTEVTHDLEREGVRKFEDSWTELLDTTRDGLRDAAPRG